VVDEESQLHGLCSKAPGGLLAEISLRAAAAHHPHVAFESFGGVEVARRIRAGYRGDVVVLDEKKVRSLEKEGFVLPASIRPLFASDAVLAVASSAPDPDISTVPALKEALLSAGPIAVSTGPSGVAFTELLRGWGMLDALGDRLITVPPGVPVGLFIARGGAALGVQQRSELIRLAGVRIVGTLPGSTAISSVFVGAVLTSSKNAGRALQFLTACAEGEAVEPLLEEFGLRSASLAR
jgi:molybdate transport system substrate-binding protein